MPRGGAGNGNHGPSSFQRQFVVAAVGLTLVYTLIAIAFLHEWGKNSSDVPSAGPPRKPAIQDVVQPSRSVARQSLTVVGMPMTVHIPPGWQGRIEGNALVFAPADAPGDASVRLYYEPGGDSMAETARRSAEYLRALAPGARVGKPQPSRLAGDRAVMVRARTAREVERASVCVAMGVRYLAIEQVSKAAASEIKREEQALVGSLQIT